MWITAYILSLLVPGLGSNSWVARSPSTCVARRVSPDGFLLGFDFEVFAHDFDDRIMYGSASAQQAAASRAAAGTSVMGSATPAGPPRDQLESRFA